MLIGVDHGNKQIKTVHCNPFVSGLQQSITKPFGQSLQYRGNYYTLSNERIPFRKDKTEDDRFFVLTLIAIAEELETRHIGKQELYNIQLPVGLPPAHFGAQAKKFTDYFKRDGIVEFVYRDKPYAIRITDVVCYPQAYAAAATMLHTLMDDPKAVVLDIGGFTADYLLLKNGKADLTSCDSLENGVILLYNKIRSRGNSELDLLLDESDVDAILAGRETQYPAEAVRLVERLAQEFVNDLFSTLRERMLDRSIPGVLPFFRGVHGRMHHAPRYKSQPEMEIHFHAAGDLTPKEKTLAEKAARAMAINFNARRVTVTFWDAQPNLKEL